MMAHGRVALLLAAVLLGAAAPARAQRITEIQVAPPYLRMVPDAQTQASATAYDSAGTPLNVRIRWASSNVNVVVVTENGMVRAVAPGAALISATALDERGRNRRTSQITVRVQNPTQVGAVPPGYGPPPTGEMPPNTRPPRAPAVMPPFMTDPRAMDSMMKASINCNEPMMNASNPMRACYDERPRPRTPVTALNVTSCAEQHGGIMLMLRVNEAGSVTEVRPFVTSRCPAVTDSVVANARTMVFTPAVKDGQPVPAWVRIMVRTGPAADAPPVRVEPARP